MTKEEWVEQLRLGTHKYHSVELLNTNVYLHGDVAKGLGRAARGVFQWFA